jgi:Fe-S-cluster containining protein
MGKKQNLLKAAIKLFSIQGFDGTTTLEIWISPVTGEDVTRCLLLGKLSKQDKYICGIHDVKPKHCRNHPKSRKHALKTGCRGFENSTDGIIL